MGGLTWDTDAAFAAAGAFAFEQATNLRVPPAER